MKKDDDCEKIEKGLYRLIELGIVEASSVDEDGNFCYSLTEEGVKLAKRLHRLDLE